MNTSNNRFTYTKYTYRVYIQYIRIYAHFVLMPKHDIMIEHSQSPVKGNVKIGGISPIKNRGYKQELYLEPKGVGLMSGGSCKCKTSKSLQYV